MPRVLLSAFGIHGGGGWVLLQPLLRAVAPELKAALLDERVRGRVAPAPAVAEYVRPSLLQRARKLQALAQRADSGDVLFCFNGLPPLSRPRGARVVAYMQGRHLLEPVPAARYAPRVAVRVALERQWLRAARRNCDEMWLQTEPMAELAARVFPGLRTRVLPFADDALAAALAPLSKPASGAGDGAGASFFYPADGVAHKNHAALLQAWQRLSQQGCRPTLYLTLPGPEFDRLLRAAAPDPLARIVNLGPLARPDALARLAASSALVFPSLLESFGLPLLEARAAGVPVLASERDFVRAVCEPAQTFDPASPQSIAQAVLRFLRAGQAPAPILSARELVQALLA